MSFYESIGRGSRPSGPKGSDWVGREGHSYEVRAVHEIESPLIDQNIIPEDQALIPEVDLEAGVGVEVDIAPKAVSLKLDTTLVTKVPPHIIF